MATGKKFYWIKLRKDFMTGDIVDFLMSQRNGAQYVVLYQLLCIMCINTNGELFRQIGEVIIPFDVDKIQRDCKYFSRDTVTIALELFKKLGLIYEQEPGCLIISDFENLIGAESDYAKQKRIQRQNDCGQDVCISVDNGTDITMDIAEDSIMDRDMDKGVDIVHSDVSNMSIQSKSIEIRDQRLEKDTDDITVSDDTVCRTDVQRVVECWNGLQCFGIKAVCRVSSGTKRYDSLIARINQYGIDDVLSAVDRIRQSGFLQGRNKKGWVITFDWFVLPNNFIKVMEGNYDNFPTQNNINSTGGTETVRQFADRAKRWAEKDDD